MENRREKTGLCDLIGELQGHDSFNTCIEGSKTIDLFLGTPALTQMRPVLQPEPIQSLQMRHSSYTGDHT
eukprot:3433343-Ditylum_brightwellii.AAC.1